MEPDLSWGISGNENSSFWDQITTKYQSSHTTKETARITPVGKCQVTSSGYDLTRS